MDRTTYNFVFYDLGIMDKFISELVSSKGKNTSRVKYAWIEHDKDIVPETGEYKKTHFHLWTTFPESVKSAVIVSLLNKCGSNESALSLKKTDNKFLAYMTHSTKGASIDKAIYCFDDIATNIPLNEFTELYYNAVSECKKGSSKAQMVSEYWQILDTAMQDYKFTSMVELTRYMSALGDNELFAWYVSKTTFFKNNYYEEFKRNRLTSYREQLENEKEGLLDYE